MELTLLQREIIDKYIKEKSVRDRLISYLSRHELVGEEIFTYLGKPVEEFAITGEDNFLYQPVHREVFIRRVPFYFYQPDTKNQRMVGKLLQYIIGMYDGGGFGNGIEEYKNRLEELFTKLERIFYHHKIDLETIFDYPVQQTGYVQKTDFLFMWAHYLDLGEGNRINEKVPRHLIVSYNHALEHAGLSPIIYDIHEMFDNEYINRTEDVLSVQGIFPCDQQGNPILRWIGLEIQNPEKVWVKVDHRLKGTLYIKVGPKTVVFGRNCWNWNNSDSDSWVELYVGPQLMYFNSQALKAIRERQRLTQREVAEAIETSIRTYQKWESGDTTPDSHNLLRLMKVLDIRDTQELTKIVL
jgi:DNA-binding XRE family transcriptional regulator